MIIGVNIGVQKVDSNAYDNLLTEEIEYYLNKAQREYIRQQNVYLKERMDNMSRQDFISESESGYNLGALLNTYTYPSADISAASEYDNAVSVNLADLPTAMFSYVYSFLKTESDSDLRQGKLISPSDVDNFVKTQYNYPIFRKYPIVIVGDQLIIFYDSESSGIYEYYLTYIKQPDKLVESNAGSGETTTPQLPSHTHDDIVDLAVGMILEDIKSARPYEQTQTTIKGENS